MKTATPKKKMCPKYPGGVQQVRARQDGQQQLVNQGVGLAAEAAAPGIGGAVVGGMSALSGLAKNEDGLYKNRTAQALDGLNPVTQIGRNIDGISGFFSGGGSISERAGRAFKGLTGDQSELKGAMEEEAQKKQQTLNRANVGVDTAGLSQVGQYKGGAKRVKAGPPVKQAYNQPGSKEPIGDTIGYNDSNRESWNDDAARRQYGDETAARTDRATQLSMGGMTSEEEALRKYPTQADVDLRNAQQVQRRGPIADKNLYKMGSKRVATKAIEIEGGEPHFSKKSGGRRSLKQYHPNGPKHIQGGIPTIAEEGDAIVTAKGAKGAQAVAAHQRGDHATVEKLINQMPADKGTSKASVGKRRVGATKSAAPQRIAAPQVSQKSYLLKDDDILKLGGTPDGLQQRAADTFIKPEVKARNPYASVTSGGNTSGANAASATYGDKALGLAQAAPTIYNLGQGLFGNTVKTTRRGYAPEQQEYQDQSGAQRQASQQAMNSQVSNARNLSGGNAGNVRSNANQAFAENATRQGGIDAQESARRLAIGNQNTDRRNEAQLQNNAMNNQADTYDLQNAAKKQEALSKGLEGISGLASQSVLQKNTLAKESADRNMLGQAYKNFTYTADQNVELRKQLAAAKVPGYKKGARNLKMKNC